MQAILTGSRAYGIPTEESDIDLVIFCSPAVKLLLEKHKDELTGNAVRYGKLNLIPCDRQEDYDAWKVGTLACERNQPCDRETAKKLFISIIPSKQVGCSGG